MEIQKEALLKTLEGLKEKGYDILKYITAVDRNSYIEVVYLLYSTLSNSSEVVVVKIDGKKPEIDTVTEIYRSADWYERELAEMFLIRIKGRNIKRLLLEEWNGGLAPLRKDYVWGSDYKKR